MAEPGLPDYLLEQPDSARRVMPPVRTSPQTLDFLALQWDNFGRLCGRLAPQGREVHHQLYGMRGRNQQGIDLTFVCPTVTAASRTGASACGMSTGRSSPQP